MAAHWRHMAPYVGGFLVPGSTGDGWEMSPPETDALLATAFELAGNLDVRILIGALRSTAERTVEAITQSLLRLRTSTGLADALEAVRLANVAGFTVCPPTGAELTQTEIGAALERVLALNVPVALYQLPQVTENEMSPELIADLARRYANLIMLKDSSGTDRVAQAICGIPCPFLVRGAEGDYVRWLRERGGSYDGLLLSTANCFAPELCEMIEDLESGRVDRAVALSARLTTAVDAVFALVGSLPYANPYSNANRAMDHWMAFGDRASSSPLPITHCGRRMPLALIQDVGRILGEAELTPRRGYLQEDIG
jgi:dihydrodipicolinate synthase/N-acetylneuraminate lyase